MDNLKEIARFMNHPNSSWQTIGSKAITSLRKAFILPDLKKIARFVPYDVKGISKNYAFATIGYHKVAQRHLMNLSDECLSKGFKRTPELTSDEIFCGTWENVDLSTSCLPATYRT